MDFRDTYCVWCRQKTGPLEDCIQCPRFRRHELNQEIELDWKAFCQVCRNYHDEGLKPFCETNRKLQQGSDEPFDCYKYDPVAQKSARSQAHVVTVFLTHQGKVCLVRRSQAVGTYQGRWSGISGYLEGDPSEHFMTELREETTLTPDEYTLTRRADTVAVEDEQEGRIWYVHPFLCEVPDPSKISLDWENTEHRWFEPGEMSGLDTVPGLSNVYDRVSRLPLERETSEFVRSLKDDRESGARQLAYRALDFLGRMTRSSNAAQAVVLMDDLHFASHEIDLARPSMAILSTALELLLRDVLVGAAWGIEDARSQILALVRKNIKEMDNALNRAVAHLDSVVSQGSTVLVHSYSSSLIQALPLLREKGCSLVVTEARPGFEGRTVARIAGDAGMRVRLVVDAAAGMELGNVDVVLMGADSIEADGSVVNKTGSSLIAMAACSLGVRVYFLGEVRKILTGGRCADIEEYGPEEVWEHAPREVEVRNLYFDRTGPEYITGIILEQGIMAPERIREVALSLAAQGSA
jgi:ribose 1,5-bisphosphate isomerase